MARPLSTFGPSRRPGDLAGYLGDVRGPELVARARAAAVTAGRITELAIREQMDLSIAEGRSDMALLHARTLELIHANYAGGDAPGPVLATREIGVCDDGCQARNTERRR